MVHRNRRNVSNISGGFIDLATKDTLEDQLYNKEGAVSYFTRTTTSCSWFTMVPCVLTRKSGIPTFGSDWSVSVSRAGDYLLSNWLRFELPEITVRTHSHLTNTFVSWTPNVAHALIRDCNITFNDLSAHHFDNYYLDFISTFTVPGGKQAGYQEMIGNTSALTTPAKTLPATIINLPLPLFFTKDTGISLAMAGLPYNDVAISFSFRELSDLLTVWEYSEEDSNFTPTTLDWSDHLGVYPELHDVQVWANYALVNNSSRKKIGEKPRDMLIEQFQHIPRQTFSPATNSYQSYDVRFSHSIKVLFWGAENTTIPSIHSNYTTASPVVTESDGVISVSHAPGSDPIDNVSLLYENTERLSGMGADYFSQVQPYYQPKCVVPTKTGYHMYAYSLDIVDPDPMGSTNFGRLTNVTVAPEASDAAVTAAESGQSFRYIIMGINHNIVRISGGAFGFPYM